MQSFHIDSPYVCIGPFDASYSASLQLSKGDLPTAWTRPASANFPPGSTVLVHDVDVRLPIKIGKWRMGRLYNPYGSVCGVIYWHSEFPSDKADLEFAAQLLHKMEDLGASVISNAENKSVLQEGIRFIGRYSWDVIDRETDQLPTHLAEDTYSVFANGPQCFFVTPKIFQNQILPEVTECFDQLNEYVNASVEKMKAEGKEESYPGEFRYKILYDRDDPTSTPYTFPNCRTYTGKSDDEKGEGGASIYFPNQEYMYGRVWMENNSDNTITDSATIPTPVCKAFCAYTYASPEFFDFMRLEDIPICPALPAITVQEILQANRSIPKAILTHLIGYTNEQLAAVMHGIAEPVRILLLQETIHCAPSLFRHLCTAGLIPWTVDLYDHLLTHLAACAQGNYFVQASEENNLESFVLVILHTVPGTIVQASIVTALAVFTRVNETITDNTFNFRSFQRPLTSHLASFLPYPTIVRKLLEIGHPIDGTLAECANFGEWYRTPFATAAYEGYIETVQLFLEKGGNIEEKIAGDPWNVIVYAAASGLAEMLSLFRTHAPHHPIWSDTSIPLHVKELPRYDLFTNELKKNDEKVEVFGTIDMVFEEAKRAREEVIAAMAAKRGGGSGTGWLVWKGTQLISHPSDGHSNEKEEE